MIHRPETDYREQLEALVRAVTGVADAIRELARAERAKADAERIERGAAREVGAIERRALYHRRYGQDAG